MVTGTRVSMAAVLFTDLVGSTAHRIRLGEEVADELRRTHDRLLTTAVERHGGTVVKGVGDGVLATFGSTSDALAAAVAIQQAAEDHSRRHRGHAFEVRIGLSVGDISVEDGDVFGTPVIEASRLCEAAGGGQILVAQLVELVSRGRGGHPFAAVGQLELKGLPDPVTALEVKWDARTAAGVPLPPALSISSPLPFAGRAELLDELLQAWKRAQAEEPGIILLAGEAGAGKTRLVAELAQRARDDGATVLYGHAEESLDTPFLAITEALRSVLAADADTSSTELFGAAAARLTRLLPELLERDPTLEAVPPEDPETDRYRTLTGICEALGHIAAPAGLLVVLDDLHWADGASVQTLRMLARSGLPERVLVVGTYRDTEVDLVGAFAQAAVDLPREATVRRVEVGGLDHAGVLELLDAASGDDDYVPEELERVGELLLAETDGNPFFVGELLLHLIESGALRVSEGVWRLTRSIEEVGVPQGVREVTGRRLALLPDGALETLSTAAVVGATFDGELVAAVTGVDLDDVVEHVDAAIGAFLVDEKGVGAYRFTHALVRSALYDALSMTRRIRTHLHIAEHLEAARPDDTDALAYHWARAAGASPEVAATAIDHAVQAGERAMERDAPDAAVDSFALALTLADDIGRRDGAWRAGVLTQLAVAERVVGKGAYADRLEMAAREALSAGRVDLAAEAMVCDRGVSMTMSDIPAERRVLQDEIVARSENLSAALRARVLAQRARDTQLCIDPEYRDLAIDAAWGALEHLSFPADAEAIAHASISIGHSAQAALRLDLVSACARRCEEAIGLLDGRDRVVVGSNFATNLIWSGRLDDAFRYTSGLVEVGDQLLEPFARSQPLWTKASVLLAQGRLRESAAALNEFLVVAESAEDPDLPMWAMAAQAVRSVQDGTLAELADFAIGAADTFTEITVWKAFAAMALAAAGRRDEAADWLDRVARVDFDAARPILYHSLGLAAAGTAATKLVSPHRLRLAELLDGVDMLLCSTADLTIDSPRYYAGLIYRSLGDLDPAVDRFRLAAAQMREIGARGYDARARAQLAATLEERDRPGDLDEARHLAVEACAIARELGTGDVLDVCGHLG